MEKADKQLDFSINPLRGLLDIAVEVNQPLEDERNKNRVYRGGKHNNKKRTTRAQRKRKRKLQKVARMANR